MITIMSDLLAEGFSKLAERQRALGAGEVLFRVGDPIRSLFLVVSGALVLSRPLPHGADLVLQRAGPGDVLAEASLFAQSYHCDAIAAQPSVMHVLRRQRVETALASDVVLARAWMAHLAQEVQRGRAVVEILSLKTVAERVDAWVALSDSGLPPKGHWRRVALEIGITPEALYRDLARRRLKGRGPRSGPMP